MESPKETPRQVLVRLLTNSVVKQLATNKDQMAALLRAHEHYASYEDVGHPPASPEYLQEVDRAIRLLDQSPDLATFLEKVKSDSLPDSKKAKFDSPPQNVAQLPGLPGPHPQIHIFVYTCVCRL